MAKELPYFKFEPAEWLAGSISLLSLECQGAYIQVCCVYWQKLANAKQKEILLRIGKDNYDKLLEFELIEELEDGNILIKWLSEQIERRLEVSKKRAESGQSGGIAKANAKQKLANAKQNLANANIIEENRIEEKRKEKKDIYRSFDHLTISVDEVDQLKSKGYTTLQIDDILNGIENYAKNKNYKNLYLTCLNWLKKEYGEKNKVPFRASHLPIL